MKKVLIITSSLRKNGNSNTLAKSFELGAIESGNQVETVSLIGKELKFCVGCLTCQNTGRCFMRDDADIIEEKMQTADVLVFATPIYYYGVSAQLKTVLDRANPLYSKNYNFKSVYFLSSATEDEEYTPKRAESCIEGWIECFEGVQLVGSVFAGGVTDVGDIKNHKALDKAYELGKSIK